MLTLDQAVNKTPQFFVKDNEEWTVSDADADAMMLASENAEHWFEVWSVHRPASDFFPSDWSDDKNQAMEAWWND